MNEEILKSLVDSLDEKKKPFLEDLQGKVKSHISSKSTNDCLILVTSLSKGRKVQWHTSDGLSYVRRLIAFLLKKDYSEDGNQYKVESALTEEVIQIVTEAFTGFYEENQKLIAEYVVANIVTNQEVSNSVFNCIINNNKATRFATAQVKGAVVHLLIKGFQERASDFTSTISHKISIAAAKAISAPISASLAAKLSAAAAHAASMSVAKVLVAKISYYIASNIGTVVVKMMASSAVKTMITKFVTAAVIAAFVKGIALKTGISFGAAATFVLVPVLVAFLIKEWTDFPEKLGESIAESISKELGADFSRTNTEILGKIFENFLGNQDQKLGLMVAQDEEVTNQLTNLLNIISA